MALIIGVIVWGYLKWGKKSWQILNTHELASRFTGS
jgi:hypothetical protein